ncbi:dihydroorotate dehydrogenase electron transfer subunit [Moorella sp. Hama-1]|uniref:dihydroorotate dehydrogenase electron transfer subunit n=1 Tax=Moorella sp. Hama-1 TaxID=2138101 RepID=UPI000D64C196|nr:dihydroorotate dehydrogenase electron transfer subunit [Moorella sp. Hama-1]BCV22691.1 dihydroorotate dehydrogenase B (NAD(+)), electron transfer subunit [Moorella sp. Hama-1]
MPQHLQVEVLTSQPVGMDICLLRLKAPDLARAARPGQFVHLRCGEGLDPFLRRPLSIHDAGAGEVTLFYQIKGRGTSWLRRRVPGSRVDLLGPLGRGFTLISGGRLALVAGGLGMAPLFFLARVARGMGNEIDFFYGARDRQGLYRLEDLEGLGVRLFLATDDGSTGFHGPVTGLWEQHLKGTSYDRAYACGPRPALATFARLAAAAGILAEVSLEERMACGFGACRGCVTALHDARGEKYYENVCTGGPVFDAAAVCWEE